MKSSDVLIIGSSAAGLVAALTGKRVHPEKTITVIRKEEKTLIPCGIPYTFASVNGTDENILPSDKMFNNSGVNLIIGEVISIDRENKTCTLNNNEKNILSETCLGNRFDPLHSGMA